MIRTKKDVRDRIAEIRVEIARIKLTPDYEPKYEDAICEEKYDIEGLQDLLRLEEFDEKSLLEIYKHAKGYEELFGCEATARMRAVVWALNREVTDEELIEVAELPDTFGEQLEALAEEIKGWKPKKETIN